MQLLVVLLVAFVATSQAFARFGRVTRTRGVLEMARKPIMAGNWKCNTDLATATQLATDLLAGTAGVDASKVDVAVCPPFLFLRDVGQVLAGSHIAVAAQNCHYEDKGAFTGAVSAPMIKSVGATYALVGHSERRATFGESDADINSALKKLLEAGVTPILCIGETKEEYDLGLCDQICATQIKKGLAGLTGEQIKDVVLAYEPVWAIGTGLTATPEIAQNVHKNIRAGLAATYGEAIADGIRIQYGGSVTPDSVDSLMAMPDIDGALVGGASLDATKFSRIVKFE